MTTEEAIRLLEIIAGNLCGQAAQNPNLWPDYMAVDMGISALRDQIERENQQPLPLAELRKMDGEPVWVLTTGHGTGMWGLVDAYHMDLEFGYGLHLPVHAFVGRIYCHKPKEG